MKLERPGQNKAMGEARFRVDWDKVRAGGPDAVLRPILAKLVSQPGGDDGEPMGAAWEHEAGDLERLEEISQMLQRGTSRHRRRLRTSMG
ncbi:hypothetical protein [Fodinicurvata halophila]|uniref:hypothetical protein n=1 Tax=Fodinicurvata halophila TaxID=1419723 RepID=UPI00362CD352